MDKPIENSKKAQTKAIVTLIIVMLIIVVAWIIFTKVKSSVLGP